MLIEGQEYLNETFEKMTLKTLPQAICLIGQYGCGKHLLASKLAEHLNIELVDITEHLDRDFLEEVSLVQVPHLFQVDIASVGIKEQNVLLKFLEDYKPLCHIVLLVENDNLVLNTILNRCAKYYFGPYTLDFLGEHAKFLLGDKWEKGLQYASTVGQLRDMVGQDIDALEELCDKVITKIGVSNFANMLSISNKFNYKDLYDKFDIDLFFRVMVLKLGKLAFTKEEYYPYYLLTAEYYSRLRDKRLKRQDLIENYLIEYWTKGRGVKNGPTT